MVTFPQIVIDGKTIGGFDSCWPPTAPARLQSCSPLVAALSVPRRSAAARRGRGWQRSHT